MKEENLEQLINYVSEHNENYYSFSKIAKKFNVKKRILKGYVYSNRNSFDITQNGYLVGYGGLNKSFFKYKTQNIQLEIN